MATFEGKSFPYNLKEIGVNAMIGAKNIRVLFLLWLLISCWAEPVQALTPSYWWIQLKDKQGTRFQLAHPEGFLSSRAIQRRLRQNIAIDISDLPVSRSYQDTLIAKGAEIVHTSKWLNGVTIRCTDTAVISAIRKLPFVTGVGLTKPALAGKMIKNKFLVEEQTTTFDPTRYGGSLTQLAQLNGQYLHEQGYRGKGIQIALLDAGFWHVDQLAAFDSLRLSGRLLGTRDFVDPTSNIFNQHSHGMSVLSCLTGNLPNSLLGTAPDAAYYLFRCEDVATEYPLEGDNWVAAAELADSLGVDVINSSLGYSEFDQATMNYTFPLLNGHTTRITQGANMAAQKGIVVFNSAGNEGTTTWRHIMAPADGEQVIAVAAVDKNGLRASFSSMGPAYGGAIKPNVAAMGSYTYLITATGVPGFSSGTSFSSPVLAGLGACLLQANPKATPALIKTALEQSGTLALHPDTLLGFGIPDLKMADLYLKSVIPKSATTYGSWQVIPNPFSTYLAIRPSETVSAERCVISFYTLQGVCVWKGSYTIQDPILVEGIAALPNGLLILVIQIGEKQYVSKVIKR